MSKSTGRRETYANRCRALTRMRAFNIAKSQRQIDKSRELGITMSDEVYYVKGLTNKRTITNERGTHTEVEVEWGNSVVPLACLEMDVNTINGLLEVGREERLTVNEALEVLGPRDYSVAEIAAINYHSIDPNKNK